MPSACLETSLPGDLVASLTYDDTVTTGPFSIGYIDDYDVDITFTRIDPPIEWLTCPPSDPEEYLAPFEPGEFTFLDTRSGCCPNEHRFVKKDFPFDGDFVEAPYFWPAGTRTNTWNGVGPMPDYLKPLAIYHLVATAFVTEMTIAHCRAEHLSYFMRPVDPVDDRAVVVPTITVIQPDTGDPNTVGEVILSYDLDPDVTGFTGVSSFSWEDPLGNAVGITIFGYDETPDLRPWFTFPQTRIEISGDYPEGAIQVLRQDNAYRLKLTGGAYAGLPVDDPVYISDGEPNEMKAEAWEKATNQIVVSIILYLNYTTYYERDPEAPPDDPPDGEYNPDSPGEVWGQIDMILDLPDDQSSFALSIDLSPGTGTMQFNTV